MERSGVAIITSIANCKADYLDRSFVRYFIYAMMAGVFCGLGMILAYSSGGALNFYETTRGFAKIVFGLSFALSFTLIVFAGSELFTGNVMVMTIGTFNKAVALGRTLWLLAAVYLGNLCGATLISLLIGATGLLDSEMVGGYIVSNTAAKMALPFGQAVARGILCNMLVCLATWASSKLKSEPAKMLILLWSVYGFCTSGYEHSIANMALFVMALVSPLRTAEITLSGYWHNMLPVTLGNLIGGVLIGVIYFYISNKECA